ncbi:hypothetical protein [Streptomyces sp. NPDC002559]
MRATISTAADRELHWRLARVWTETEAYTGPVPTLDAAVAAVAEEADLVMEAVLAHGALDPGLACRVTEAVEALAAALAAVPGAGPHLATVQKAMTDVRAAAVAEADRSRRP